MLGTCIRAEFLLAGSLCGFIQECSNVFLNAIHIETGTNFLILSQRSNFKAVCTTTSDKEGQAVVDDMMSKTVLDKYQASVFAFVVGDALGAATEFLSAEEIVSRYGKVEELLGGRYGKIAKGDGTDDTQMLLCVARSLIETEELHLKDIADRFVKWYLDKPIGIGDICQRSISRYYNGGSLEAPYNVLDAGNGGVMRALPAVLRFRRDKRLACFAAVMQSRITHNCKLSDYSCTVYTELLLKALNGDSKEEMERYAKEHPIFYLDEYDGMSGGYVVETMRSIMHCFFSTSSLKEALTLAANLGHDTDTIAALTGGIAGAYYGLAGFPKEWLADMNPYVLEECIAISRKLLRLSDESYEGSFDSLFKFRGVNAHSSDPIREIESGMDLLSKYKAVLLGFSIGDRFQDLNQLWKNRQDDENALIDDMAMEMAFNGEYCGFVEAYATQMMLSVAVSVTKWKRLIPKDISWRLQNIVSGKATFLISALELMRGRELPLVLLYRNDASMLHEAIVKEARIIGDSEIAETAALCYAEVVREALNGKSKEQLKEIISRSSCYASNGSNQNEERGIFSVLRMAFDCFLNTDTMEEAIEQASMNGKGEDAVSALCGGLSGAFYGMGGVPNRWMAHVERNVKTDISNLAEKLLALSLDAA